MVKWFTPLVFLLVVFPVVSQDVDLSGSWQVYQANELAKYSLKEHLGTDPLVTTKDMILNTDGTVSANIPNLDILKWMIDEGFLLFETPKGNKFYHPRPLSTDIYFLVNVDVLERNEDIVSITSRPQGNLLIIKK